MVETRFVKFRYLSISFARRGETDRLLTPIRGMPASSFGGRCLPRRRGRGAGAPHFLVEPIVQWHTFCECWSIPGASLVGNFEGKMPGLMSNAAPRLPTSGRQYRPRTVQCRSRRSFLEGNGRANSQDARRTHLIKINALTAVTY